MANITTTVPNLIQGVSQQSPQVRLAGQCEEQINGLSTVTKGLTKRPPARLIDNLGAVALEGDFLHFINRSETERYVVTVCEVVVSTTQVDLQRGQSQGQEARRGKICDQVCLCGGVGEDIFHRQGGLQQQGPPRHCQKLLGPLF